MDKRISELLEEIAELEDELRRELHDRRQQVHFSIQGKRIEFEKEAKDLHQKLKRGLARWIVTDRPQNLLTGPIIYAMAVPLAILDLVVTFYQAACFPIYRIKKVDRSKYIAFDRHRLGYLNSIERFHCEYCAYANGLLAYATEITARTEQYFCPVKHAHQVLGTHSRYVRFLEYGDAADFHRRLEAFRVALNKEEDATPPSGLGVSSERSPEGSALTTAVEPRRPY